MAIRNVPRETTLTMKVAVSGEEREGDFTFRRPTLADRARIGGTATRLSGGANEVAVSRAAAQVMAELLVCVKRDDDGKPMWPDWFDFDKMDDEDTAALFAVYGEFAKWRDTFRAGRPTGTLASGETGKPPAA